MGHHPPGCRDLALKFRTASSRLLFRALSPGLERDHSPLGSVKTTAVADFLSPFSFALVRGRPSLLFFANLGWPLSRSAAFFPSREGSCLRPHPSANRGPFLHASHTFGPLPERVRCTKSSSFWPLCRRVRLLQVRLRGWRGRQLPRLIWSNLHLHCAKLQARVAIIRAPGRVDVLPGLLIHRTSYETVMKSSA